MTGDLGESVAFMQTVLGGRVAAKKEGSTPAAALKPVSR